MYNQGAQGHWDMLRNMVLKVRSASYFLWKFDNQGMCDSSSEHTEPYCRSSSVFEDLQAFFQDFDVLREESHDTV